MALQEAVNTPLDPSTEPSGGLILRRDTELGCLKAVGEDALDLLNRLSTNKVDQLQPGHWAPTVLTSDRGRIVDLLCVANAGESVWLLTSRDQQQPVIDWLDKYTIMEELVVEDASESMCVLALAGEGWHAVLGLSAPPDPERLPGMQYPCPSVGLAGHDVIAIDQPLGAEPCCYLLAPRGSADAVAAALLQAGAREADSGLWEAMRVAWGAPAYGIELGEPFNPLEAGLIGAIDFTKGCYIGQEVIARLDSYQKVQKYLATLRFSSGSDVLPGAELQRDGRPAGVVTSVSRTAHGELLGLGYVRTTAALAGELLELCTPATGTATVVGMPKLFGPGQDFS